MFRASLAESSRGTPSPSVNLPKGKRSTALEVDEESPSRLAFFLSPDGSLLALRREDVNLETGFALSRAADNKGKRDVLVPLHPLAIEHLRKLASFSPLVFPWDHDRRGLFTEFHTIQKAADVRPEGTKRWYGFHDLRRAFATMNAATLTADALQALMQHKSYQTTQKCINMARQLSPAVQNLYVPNLKATGTVG